MATSSTFTGIIDNVLRGKARLKKFQRLKLKFKSQKRFVNVLNDILICHENPAAVSRYALTVNGITEEQRSSGLWVATCAGSSGAIKSAGGRALDRFDKKIQYRPRELLLHHNRKYKLTGCVLKERSFMRIRSLMRRGMVYIDGAHFRIPFSFGETVTISHSLQTLSVVMG